MTELEPTLQGLTSALLAGNGDEAKQKVFAALAKGSRQSEILDAIVEAINIVCDLQELGQYDQSKVASQESSVNSCLQLLEDWLVKSEGRFNVKVTVGPVGLKSGALSSLALSASLRSVGFRSTSLGKTQTALDLLRNSEELNVDLVIPLLAGDGDASLRSFVDAYERGGFRSKFQVIPVAASSSENVQGMTVARNSSEAISKATEWAMRKTRKAT